MTEKCRERKKFVAPILLHCIFSAFVCGEKYEQCYPCLPIFFWAVPLEYSI